MADDSELSEQEKLARAQREELERQKTAKEIEETKNKIKESKKKQDQEEALRHLIRNILF